MFNLESIKRIIEEIKNGTFDFSTFSDEDLEELRHQNEVVATLSRTYWAAQQLDQIQKSQNINKENQ